MQQHGRVKRAGGFISGLISSLGQIARRAGTAAMRGGRYAGSRVAEGVRAFGRGGRVTGEFIRALPRSVLTRLRGGVPALTYNNAPAIILNQVERGALS